uniref:DUF7869 domain-containing protein n=1 Tax=Romanomermis culicivorax TaxID=13658 RepID=A0A915I7V9_ROMCU
MPTDDGGEDYDDGAENHAEGENNDNGDNFDGDNGDNEIIRNLKYRSRFSLETEEQRKLETQHSYCFLWDETHGARGSVEIGTCLLTYLRNFPAHIKKVILFSDNCSGQNRNQHVASMFALAVVALPNIESIEHKFLVKGHTQMECDSIHAGIEVEKRESLHLFHLSMVGCDGEG